MKGQKLTNDSPLSERITQAYLSKYHQEENIFYARGITRPEYKDLTMEFLYDPPEG